MRASACWICSLRLSACDFIDDLAFAVRISLLTFAPLVTRMTHLYSKASFPVPASETSNAELQVGFKATH
jgi:hypothetical protein